MAQVYRNSKTSLSTTSSEDKYFYLTNSNYYSYSNYIYICLEDNNFGLSYNNIKYCGTNTNPNLSSYIYSIINYEGSYSSGNLYVTSDYQIISNEDNEGISTGAIIGIVIGSIIFLITFIIIIYHCCPCCRKNKINFIPVTQPYYPDLNSFPYPSNQTNMLLPIDNPNIQLQPVTVPNEAD